MFKDIFDNNPVAMIIYDHDGVITATNNHTEKLFGYTNDELTNINIRTLIPSYNPEATLPKEYLTVINKNDSTEFPVEIATNPITFNNDDYSLVTIIDISERKRAEERFKAAFDGAPNGMLMTDEHGRIILVNKKTEEIFGYSKEEIQDQPIELLVPDKFKKPHPNFINTYLKNAEPRPMGTGRELFGKHKTGKLIPVEIGLQPITFSNENYIISSVVDISEKKLYEQQVDNKNNEIREFSYRTSHDLKSPLLTVSGILDFISRDIEKGNTASIQADIKRAKSLATKLRMLVDDILLLTKADMDSETKEHFDFDVYLQELKEKYDHLFTEFHVEPRHDLKHKQTLSVQKTRLTQVLDNLISNSTKYSDPDKHPRYVQLSTISADDTFLIKIEDNGLGIPEDQYDNVFGMFKRFHNTNIDSSGLGLYMIKKHVDRMHGSIGFQSSPAGTIFTLELPLS